MNERRKLWDSFFPKIFDIFFSVHRWMAGGHIGGAGPGRHVWPGMKELARNLHARNWSKRTNAGDADGFRVRERGCGCGCGPLAACARKINGTGSTLSAPAWSVGTLQCLRRVCLHI